MGHHPKLQQLSGVNPQPIRVINMSTPASIESRSRAVDALQSSLTGSTSQMQARTFVLAVLSPDQRQFPRISTPNHSTLSTDSDLDDPQPTHSPSPMGKGLDRFGQKPGLRSTRPVTSAPSSLVSVSSW